ncbi:hypothetical protein CR513_03805, partial [Mucuna pruriens]
MKRVSLPKTLNLYAVLDGPQRKAKGAVVTLARKDKVNAVKQQLSNIHPEVLLFLLKIRHLSVREDNGDP